MAKFAYNNIKNAITNYIIFKLNCSYYIYTFYKKNVNFYIKSKTANNIRVEL